MKPGMIVTKDLRTDRVRIFVDKKNNVIKTPIIGWLYILFISYINKKYIYKIRIKNLNKNSL